MWSCARCRAVLALPLSGSAALEPCSAAARELGAAATLEPVAGAALEPAAAVAVWAPRPLALEGAGRSVEQADAAVAPPLRAGQPGAASVVAAEASLT